MLFLTPNQQCQRTEWKFKKTAKSVINYILLQKPQTSVGAKYVWPASEPTLAMADLLSRTCTTRVEPERGTWKRKVNSPEGSPIFSARRWNVLRGTMIRRRQKFIWAMWINALYLRCHRCIPANHQPHPLSSSSSSSYSFIASCKSKLKTLVEKKWKIKSIKHCSWRLHTAYEQ